MNLFLLMHMGNNFKSRLKCRNRKKKKYRHASTQKFNCDILKFSSKNKIVSIFYSALVISDKEKNGISFVGRREVNLLHCILFTSKKCFTMVTCYFYNNKWLT